MLILVAKAIIYRGGSYLLQLRDDSSDISYPNQWSFFGGEIELGETPWQALVRELEEELEWRPEKGGFLYHWFNPDNPCCIHFFSVPFTGSTQQLILHEGQSFEWFTLLKIKQTNSVAPYTVQHLVQAGKHGKF